jgi:hypothetical protein
MRQIVLLDGPAVLGWKEWRDTQIRYGFNLLRSYLEEAIYAGALRAQAVEPLVHLLAGVMNEAALVIAQAEDQASAREEMGAAVGRVLRSLGNGHASARHSRIPPSGKS